MSFESPVNIFVIIPSLFKFFIASFASFFISSARVILPINSPSIFKYKFVPMLLSFISLLPTKFLFPIFTFFPSTLYSIPFPATSLYSFISSAFISLFHLLIIDFAIGWFEKLSPYAKYSKIFSSE